MRGKIILLGLVLLSLFSPVWAETTCEAKDCKITITIKIAFAFDQRIQNQSQYMQNVKDEIERIWNGDQGRTFGDCKCPVSFKVETKKITDAGQVNCNPGPPGYHCIMVTDFNNNPPRNQSSWTGAKFYAGYMYGIATGNGGNSQKGWWSNILSRPVNASDPTGEHYIDYAHEAGHMMGLEDGDGGIMDITNGANAQVQQTHIDEIVTEICGANACPGRCCCGNGKIDKDQGEQCDPFVGGCPSDEYCCPVCCNCWGKVCFPEWGEYANQADCQTNCGTNARCYYNYQTGCWDCVTFNVVEEVPYDDTKLYQIIDEAHPTRNTELDAIRNFYEEGLLAAPTLGDYLANERANIIIEGKNNYHALTDEGELYEVDTGTIDDPTMEIVTDEGTLADINSGELHPLAAYNENKVKVNGIGFFEGIKFWFAELMFNTFVSDDMISDIEWTGTEEVSETEEVPEVQEIMEAGPEVPARGSQYPGVVPDETFIIPVGSYVDVGFWGEEVYTHVYANPYG